MSFKPLILPAVLAIAASVAVAHENVTNQTVMARMHNMEAIANATRTLGEISKGTMDYDDAAIEKALAELNEAAARVTADFEPNESDPESRALPAIWAEFDDFTAKADALTTLVGGLGSIEGPDALAAVVSEIGQTCAACHKLYRAPK